MSNAKFYDLPENVAAEMSAAMDIAASGYWAYPDTEWQIAFEKSWLESHGYFVDAGE